MKTTRTWGCTIVQHYPFARFRRDDGREEVSRLELVRRAGVAVARLLAGPNAGVVESVLVDHEGLHVNAPLVRTGDDIRADLRACHEALARDVESVIVDPPAAITSEEEALTPTTARPWRSDVVRLTPDPSRGW